MIFMPAAVEETATTLLRAVIDLYGCEAFPEIALAFRYALTQTDDTAIARALSEALIEIVRNRTLAAGDQTQ
jgi:hypothetical protein